MAEEHGDPAPDVGFHAAFAERHHHDVVPKGRDGTLPNGLLSLKFPRLFDQEKLCPACQLRLFRGLKTETLLPGC